MLQPGSGRWKREEGGEEGGEGGEDEDEDEDEVDVLRRKKTILEKEMEREKKKNILRVNGTEIGLKQMDQIAEQICLKS